MSSRISGKKEVGYKDSPVCLSFFPVARPRVCCKTPSLRSKLIRLTQKSEAKKVKQLQGGGDMLNFELESSNLPLLRHRVCHSLS